MDGALEIRAQDFFLGWRRAFDGGEDQFQLLDEDTFDLQELGFILAGEFFQAREVDEIIELLEAFQIILQLQDELIDFACCHKNCQVIVGLESFWFEKDDGAAAQFAGGYFKSAIAHINSVNGNEASRASLKTVSSIVADFPV